MKWEKLEIISIEICWICILLITFFISYSVDTKLPKLVTFGLIFNFIIIDRINDSYKINEIDII